MTVALKCTAFFQSNEGKGWAESHWRIIDTPVAALLPFMSQFQALMENFRVPLLAADCFLKGVRVSYATSDGSIASSPFRYAPVKRPANQQRGASPSIAVMARMGTASNSQFSPTYLRGFWDSIETDEEVDFVNGDGPVWKGLLDRYVSALVAQPYGFLGQSDTLSRRGRVTGYTTDVNGRITFVVFPVSGPAFPAFGSPPFQIRISRLNQSKSILNRTQIVTVVDATHLETVVPTAALEFTSAGTYVQDVQTFLAYTGLQYAILARKPMGRPTSLSLARRRATPRG